MLLYNAVGCAGGEATLENTFVPHDNARRTLSCGTKSVILERLRAPNL